MLTRVISRQGSNAEVLFDKITSDSYILTMHVADNGI